MIYVAKWLSRWIAFSVAVFLVLLVGVVLAKSLASFVVWSWLGFPDWSIFRALAAFSVLWGFAYTSNLESHNRGEDWF